MPASSRGNSEMYLNASTRKQACNACRRRKKRCDGMRPICSACAKWGADCVYTASPGPLGYPLSSAISIDSDPLSASAGMRTPAGLDRVLMIPNSNPPPCSGRSSPVIFAPDSALLLSDLDRDLTYADDFGNFPLWSNVLSLPAPSVSVSTSSSSDADVLQLSEAFFTDVHPLLPCIHQASYMRSFHSADRGAPALKWAILANAAHVHGDFAIQNQSGHYLQKALELIDMKHSPQEQPLRIVQAGLWCAYLLYRLGKTNWSATVLAQAYTLACLNRFHQIDDPDRSKKVVSNMTMIEREECRSTMWMLYLLDRQVNYLVGLHFVINDRLFSVNYPLDNMSLQNGLVVEEQPFRRNLDYLSTIEETDSKGIFFLRALCKAVALLGRVVEYKNMTPTSSRLDQQQQQSDFDALQSAVARLWLSLPECTHNLLKVDPEHVVHTVWLSTIMHTTSLILFYNTTADVWLRGNGRLSGGDNFVCAFKSVQRILNTVRRAAGLSFRCLLNPMLAPSYFLCSRLLLIQHYRTVDPSYRLDLGLLQTVLERMRSESQAQLAQAYLDIIQSDSIGDKPAQSTFPFISPTDLCFLV